MFFALLISAVITTAGFLSTDAILKLVGTPASIVPVAAPYLKMHFIGFTIMYAGYLIGAILRGIGDSKTPLYFMVVGVIINAILDPLLIIGVGPFPRLGLVGAAVASIVGQAVGTVVGYIYLRRKKNLVASRRDRCAAAASRSGHDERYLVDRSSRQRDKGSSGWNGHVPDQLRSSGHRTGRRRGQGGGGRSGSGRFQRREAADHL